MILAIATQSLVPKPRLDICASVKLSFPIAADSL